MKIRRLVLVVGLSIALGFTYSAFADPNCMKDCGWGDICATSTRGCSGIGEDGCKVTLCGEHGVCPYTDNYEDRCAAYPDFYCSPYPP